MKRGCKTPLFFLNLSKMKKSNYILIITLVLINLIFYKGIAQESDDTTYLINQYFQLNQEASLILKNKMPTNNNKILSQDNFVNLKQVGSKNVIDIKQNGNDTEVVNQVGNKNYYSFINYYNNSPLNLNILQKGNSNNLQIYGQNRLIENMSIIQNSSFKTIIIKNH